MDQDTVVSVNLAGGWRLVEALNARGFPVEAAFWAKRSDERWILYLVSPRVDEQGPRAAYLLIHSILQESPEWGLNALTVTALRTGDSLARAAAEVVRPKVPAGPVAAPNPKSSGVTKLGDTSLGGNPVDGAFIYPPWEPGLTPAW